MIQIPNAVGLILCEKAITEEGTKNVTLVNTFNRLDRPTFPALLRDFLVCGLLTDALGTMTLSLVITRLETLEELLTISGEVRFTNPIAERRLRIAVNRIEFPSPGRYQISLLANGEWVAQCVLQVNHVEG